MTHNWVATFYYSDGSERDTESYRYRVEAEADIKKWIEEHRPKEEWSMTWQGNHAIEWKNLDNSEQIILEESWSRDPYLDIRDERQRQVAKWGNQENLIDGTGKSVYKIMAEEHKIINDNIDQVQFSHVLLEEVYEALSETDLTKLREELVQVAAVAVKWIENIDRRGRCKNAHN